MPLLKGRVWPQANSINGSTAKVSEEIYRRTRVLPMHEVFEDYTSTSWHHTARPAQSARKQSFFGLNLFARRPSALHNLGGSSWHKTDRSDQKRHPDRHEHKCRYHAPTKIISIHRRNIASHEGPNS